MSVIVNYTSSACNHVPHSLDWGNNGLMCYSTCNAIAIVESQGDKGASVVVQTLTGHRDRVNSVRWIRNTKSENEIISTSSDKRAIVWKRVGTSYMFKDVCILEGHSDAVTIANAIYSDVIPSTNKSTENTLIATASSDSSVKIWYRENETEKITCAQTIPLKRGFCFDIKWIILPASDIPLLILGTDDMMVHLYSYQGSELARVMSLVGHEDWVHSIDAVTLDNGDIMIASAAQDSMIRLWRLMAVIDVNQSKDIIDSNEIKLKENKISAFIEDNHLHHYVVNLESVLLGHENWVYGLHWHPALFIGNKWHQPLKLLSGSMDKTVIIWKPDEESGVWIETVRLGEVGGNTLGFYGCKFGPNGQSVIAHGYQGAFHLWHKQGNDSFDTGVAVGGHFAEVHDLDWEPEGSFIVTVSNDQTARLHAPWLKSGDKVTWHEIARPQIHGYDMSCISMVSRFMFVSGADEKVLRAFEAPRNFVENFGRICNVDVTSFLDEKKGRGGPEGASVPALGLSNKAVFCTEDKFVGEKHPKDIYPESYFVSVALAAPPSEDLLLQNTLWPEIQKMYGHGYEVYCIACDRKQSVLASACKASKPEHAAILLWEIPTWKLLGKLEGHSLTVTQMEFSPCSCYLLSVSRDRTWRLYKKAVANNGLPYEGIAFSDKKTSIHTRIIWSCAWSHNSQYFVTGSRDKKVIVWGNPNIEESSNTCLSGWTSCSTVLTLPHGVTAVDFAPCQINAKRYLIAIGLEMGVIHLYNWDADNSQCSPNMWNLYLIIDQAMAHHLAVRRIRFQPLHDEHNKQEPGSGMLQFASCSEDFCVRVYSVEVMFA